MLPIDSAGNTGPESDPSKQLFVEDIVGSPKTREVFEQDDRDELRQVSKIVLMELEELGVADAPKLKKKMAELEVTGREQGSPLASIAAQYFKEWEILPAGKERDDFCRLGCLSEVTECLALAYIYRDWDTVEEANIKLMEHARFLIPEPHNTLLSYIESLPRR
jgi:hypothetical protein